MCGPLTSCQKLSSGSYCDSTKEVCMCTNSLPSCAGKVSGEYCDKTANSGEGICKCSDTVDECSGNTPICSNGICISKFIVFPTFFLDHTVHIT